MFKLNTKQKIEDWLNDNTITNYTIHDDLTVDVYEDIFITRRRKKLPFQFGIVEGHFFSSSMGLESLEGAPRIVTGIFRCSNNPIKSLKYGPVEVGGDYICDNTKITDLQFSPETVGGYFECRSCELISLQGSPKKINGYFNCSYNEIQSFEYSPELINGNFDCSHNKILSFEYSPELINGDFHAEFNAFKSFKHFPKKVEDATLNGNPLLTIDMLDDLIDCTFDSIICDFVSNKEESLHVLNIIKAKREKNILDNSILKNSKHESKKRL